MCHVANKNCSNTDLFVSHILYNNKLKKTVRGGGQEWEVESTVETALMSGQLQEVC